MPDPPVEVPAPRSTVTPSSAADVSYVSPYAGVSATVDGVVAVTGVDPVVASVAGQRVAMGRARDVLEVDQGVEALTGSDACGRPTQRHRDRGRGCRVVDRVLAAQSPSRLSLPSPPAMKSSPPPPVIVSLPAPPVSVMSLTPGPKLPSIVMAVG